MKTRRIALAAAAVGALAGGGLLGVGWMVGAFVSDYGEALASGPEGLGAGNDSSSGGGTVLLLLALGIGLAGLVPLLLAPLLERARARATGAGDVR